MSTLHMESKTAMDFFRAGFEADPGIQGDGQRHQTLGVGYTEELVDSLSKAILAASALVDKASESQEFAAGARAYASMVGKFNADGSFGFPLLGVALKKSTTKSDGKIVQTVSAGF